MNIIPRELLVKIAGFCHIDDINSLSIITKYLANLRLYRLYIGYLVLQRFNGDYNIVTFQNDMRYYLSPVDSIKYNLGNYLLDLEYLILGSDSIPLYNKYRSVFYYKYIHSYLLKSILRGNESLETLSSKFKNSNEILYNNRLHNVYRVSIVVYRLLKNNHSTVLALIY